MADLTREQASAAIVAFASSARLAIVGNDAAKLAGWSDKAIVAQTYLDFPGQLDDTTIYALQVEVDARGQTETVEQLCDKILNKASETRVLRAKLDGLEDRLKTAIKYAPDGTDFDMLLAMAKGAALQTLADLGYSL